MSDELKYSLEKFRNAVKRLEEGIDESKNQLDRDGVIQRFEFTFELCWKTLRLFLINEGIITKSPRDALVEGFRFGLIKNEKVFLDMLEDRNQTSHIYSEDFSEQVYNRISTQYIQPLKKLSDKIKKSASK